MKIDYRPEIDGLRGISVISVIIYHLDLSLNNINIFSSGFLGVDIFFVISGYLITTIIIKELIQTENFSFLYFYERRVRRILPVLLLIITVSWIISWFTLIPSYFVEFSKSAIFTILFTSNFFFYFSEIDYWSINNLTKPLLHTWSLGVEEQFYLIFPIILFVFFKKFYKYLIIVIIIIFCLSLISSFILDKTNNEFNFYMLQTRSWELLSGSLVSFFSKNSDFLQIIRLILVCSTCTLIYCINKNSLIFKILSSKVLVNIGLISYSAYLWHYPIFSFANINNFFDTNSEKMLILISTMFISTITYLIIEKPFRDKSKKFKPIIFFITTLSFSILIISNISINKDGFNKRDKFLNNMGIKIDNYVLDQGYYIKNHLYEFSKNYVPNNFEKKSRNNILIIGNSFANSLFQAFDYNKDLFKDYNIELVSPKIRSEKMRYEVRCFLDFLKYDESFCKNLKFEFTNNIIRQFNNADTILIASRWDKNFDDIEVLDEVISLLIQNKKKVVLVDNPTILETYTAFAINIFDYFVYQKGSLPSKLEVDLIEKEFFKDLENKKKHYEVININNKIEILSKKYNIKLLKNKSYQCNEMKKKCFLVTENNDKIYIDDIHFTNEGASFFGKLIYEKQLFDID